MVVGAIKEVRYGLEQGGRIQFLTIIGKFFDGQAVRIVSLRYLLYPESSTYRKHNSRILAASTRENGARAHVRMALSLIAQPRSGIILHAF